MTKKWKLITLALIVVLGLIWLRREPALIFSSDGISFSYPAGYSEQTKPEPQVNQAETLLKLRRPDHFGTIEFAKETDAKTGALITKTNFLDYLENNASQSLPFVYPGFNKFKTQRIKIDGRDASVISFSYLGSDSATTIYMNFYIIPLNNDGFYLTFQSSDQAKLASDSNYVQASLQID